MLESDKCSTFAKENRTPMQTINITHELKRFEQHLSRNPQTILSAKFGDGKTYFLNEYIHQHEVDTFFVVLHPVNYVVSPNEDIFEYIKRDILCALMQTEELQKIDWKKTIKDVVLGKDFAKLTDDMLTMLAPHLQMISEVTPIAKILPKSVDLVMQVRDKVSLKKYIEHFQEVKGGLFELDDISIVIQKTIQAIQAQDKRCVLIIEDLDRLDPGHLFRILNVLSAHIDSDKCTNKFCFDNIVAVLDYDTTRHIFHHFYGEKANYEGYMSKFMSSHPFEYSITKVAHEQLFNYIEKECHFSALSEFPSNVNNVTLPQYLASLSVRDVAHILDKIELQIDSQDVELPYLNGIIRSADYLTRLLAVLVRMGYRVGYNALIDFFVEDLNWFKLLNNYVLLSPEAMGMALKIHSKSFRFSSLTKEGYENVIWIEPYVGEYSPLSIKDIVKTALNVAINRVKDCRQIIILNDISLGEVYHE